MEFTAHLSYLFSDMSLAEGLRRARDAGFTHVESVWPEDGGAELKTLLRGAGLELYLVNIAGGTVAAGGAGCLNDPARRAEGLASIAAAVSLGAQLVHVLVGRGTGLEHVVDALREAVDGLQGATTLVVEHLNPESSPGYLVPTPRDAADLVERVGSDRFRMVYDAFHAEMVGLDAAQAFATYAPYAAHVHYAEAPGRLAGDRFQALVEAVAATPYSGRVGLEYFARGAAVPYPQAR